MTFKSFVWPHNPKNIEFKIVNNSKTYFLPDLGPVTKYIGKNYRVISGYGEFFGPDAINQFEQLSKTFEQPSSGKLSIPPISTLFAFFTELSMLAGTKPQLIEYKFKFVQDLSRSPANPIKSTTKFYSVDKHENLWDIANKTNSSVETLLNFNPSVFDPNNLVTGTRLLLQ